MTEFVEGQLVEFIFPQMGIHYLVRLENVPDKGNLAGRIVKILGRDPVNRQVGEDVFLEQNEYVKEIQ